jgi:phosphate:Na+ symporter
MNNTHWFLILLNCLAGLTLFLYGVTNLSNSLKAIASVKMKRVLEKSTNNIFAGILTGIIVTTILDSSSAVIIMVIAMVNAQLLTSRQAFGLILGSNIGTTVSSQLIAFDIGEYSAVPLIIGFIIIFVSKGEKIKQIGKAILGFGLVFFGLYYISLSVEPLSTLPTFTNLMTQIENPLSGALAGAIATFVIQSSSATMGIVLSLSNEGLISFAAAVAVMFGAEIGTCSNTLIASIGRTRDAIRTGVFHLFFNIVSVILGIILIGPFISLVNLISGEARVGRQIANAHVMFNVLSVAIFIAFVPLISRLLIRLIPDKETKIATTQL